MPGQKTLKRSCSTTTSNIARLKLNRRNALVLRIILENSLLVYGDSWQLCSCSRYCTDHLAMAFETRLAGSPQTASKYAVYILILVCLDVSRCILMLRRGHCGTATNQHLMCKHVWHKPAHGMQRPSLTKQVPIAGTKDVVGNVQRLLPSLLARIELLDGLQEDTEAVIGQPLPAPNSTIMVGSKPSK